MNAEERKTEALIRISEILYWMWDPIDIKKFVTWVRDEYDSYVVGIYNLLDTGSTAEEIAEYLQELLVELFEIEKLSEDELEKQQEVAKTLKVVFDEVNSEKWKGFTVFGLDSNPCPINIGVNLN